MHTGRTFVFSGGYVPTVLIHILCIYARTMEAILKNMDKHTSIDPLETDVLISTK